MFLRRFEAMSPVTLRVARDIFLPLQLSGSEPADSTFLLVLDYLFLLLGDEVELIGKGLEL